VCFLKGNPFFIDKMMITTTTTPSSSSSLSSSKKAIDEMNMKAQLLLPDMRKEIGTIADHISDEQLIKFLRWKPDVQRAVQRFHAHLEWQRRNPGLFDNTLRISKDKELERLLQTDVVIAPPQCRTRVGGPLIIGRLRNNDMHDGRSPKDVCRMMFYTLDRVLDDPAAQLYGVTVLHDLKGFDKKKNGHIEIPKTLLGGIIGHFPIRIRAIYLLDPPWWFATVFTIMSSLLFPKKLKQRCHFIKNKTEIYHDIDPKMLIKELGGEVEFDSSEWVKQQKEREQNETFISLTDMVK